MPIKKIFSKRFSDLIKKGKSLSSALKPIKPIFPTGIALTVIGAILLGLSFYPNFTFLPDLSYWDSTVIIEPDETKKVEIGFIKKTSVFIGKIIVYTPESPKIVVSLMDSSGLSIFPKFTMQALVDGNYSFVFQAPKDDFYYFYFDNSFSSVVSSSNYAKTVVWKIYYYDDYSFYFQASGIPSLISGLACIGYQLKSISEKRVLRISVETYEALQERAKTSNKTIEEIIDEIVTKLEKSE